MGFNL